jgi:hypothetical protein
VHSHGTAESHHHVEVNGSWTRSPGKTVDVPRSLSGTDCLHSVSQTESGPVLSRKDQMIPRGRGTNFLLANCSHNNFSFCGPNNDKPHFKQLDSGRIRDGPMEINYVCPNAAGLELGRLPIVMMNLKDTDNSIMQIQFSDELSHCNSVARRPAF